jgi:hypothetical protein
MGRADLLCLAPNGSFGPKADMPAFFARSPKNQPATSPIWDREKNKRRRGNDDAVAQREHERGVADELVYS